MTPEQREQLRCELMEGKNPMLADVIERNIGIIELLKRDSEDAKSTQDRVSDQITAWSGSMNFVYLHLGSC